MARFTPKDLQNEIKSANDILAHSCSNYFFIYNPVYEWQSVDIAYIDQNGKVEHVGNIGRGTSRECDASMTSEMRSRQGEISFRDKPSRLMALERLKLEIDINTNVSRLSLLQLGMLADWAKLTKYRKSATSSHSTGAAFWLHLQKLNKKQK